MSDEQKIDNTRCQQCGGLLIRRTADSIVTCPDCLKAFCTPTCMVLHNGLGALLE